ncbi:DUF262 domain-containing protein [Pseudomonas beijingensis]|uniref:DUF262 domain-containing protein n=1 Tax=Pseudomonas beijingensis TaxID=2954101 RepID=UPI002735B67F|nr:DUF262 domain-containing protein [Pseudomonas sp. FP2262]WLH46674.1 DUF262 domain-containing protein [Pseudomonas sp. FP2262]
MSDITDKLEEVENATYENEDFQDVPPTDIVAYNELRSCADLFRMYEDEALDIQPSFQREIAWKGPAQTRFVDSLIKQLPIPSLCFSYDYKNEEWQVIDGLQRVSSIIKFLDDDSDWVLASLDDIDPRIANKSVKEFKKKGSELNKLRRRVENATLPITVLRCDPSLESHSNYLFTIFHRLNTGGTKLNNQEIRNCIYSGPFNDLLKTLDAEPDWLLLHKLETPVNDRFRRQELILRFFAFFDTFETYKEGLAKFLNNYMRSHRKDPAQVIIDKHKLFNRVLAVVVGKLKGKIGERVNITFLEALLVGIARNIDNVEVMTVPDIENRYDQLKANDELSEEKLVEGLSKTVRVQGRLKAAENAFR